MRACSAVLLCVVVAACSSEPRTNHGAFPEELTGPLGSPLAHATPEQLATFERGLAISNRRFDRESGLGPSFNVTFCGSCHEKPTPGGSAGLYRNFFLAGTQLEDGPFFAGNGVSLFDCGDAETPPALREASPPAESSAGVFNGVLRMYSYGDNLDPRPAPEAELNVVAQRNPIPFFGVGLLAELSDEEILSRADPDDEDGDGISGRPNFDRGFVGRFGLKAQTVSIEGFIRGPLFNHLGITTDPLTDAQRRQLPVDSSAREAELGASRWLGEAVRARAQAAAPSGPNCDLDDAPDPEMGRDDLFDLVSYAMLLAAPGPEPLNPQRVRGLQIFDRLGCDSCHSPRLEGPRGALPAYSDLLLHDMGLALADGVPFGEASGSEFRTQPLWGITATGPYLHDGRAQTIEEAIRWHGGEAQQSVDQFGELTRDEIDDLLEFLLSLGGRNQYSPGLVAPTDPNPNPGVLGGPIASANDDERARFTAGRAMFNREFGHVDGVGAPRMNGDSCRACHFEPTIGGAGPRGVNVMRHGILTDSGDFAVPTVGTILHKTSSLLDNGNFPQSEANIFEHRQTPPLYGLGLIESIPEAAILARVDPFDADGDGISGRESRIDGGRLGRFGWKGQIPSLAEFVRDAVTAELGMTLPPQAGLTFGRIHDNDAVLDPEMSLEQAGQLEDYMRLLAAPERRPSPSPNAAALGEGLFETVGCAECHTPSLPGANGPVRLYSDLLLHEVLPRTSPGIEDGSANMWEFRTPPLWGIGLTGPYMHSGDADTLDQAIRLHDGEASAVRANYEALSPAEQIWLITFLETL